MSRQNQTVMNQNTDCGTIHLQRVSHMHTSLEADTFRLFTVDLDAASWLGAITTSQLQRSCSHASRNEICSRTGRCTVRTPAKCNSRSKPTAVRALSLKALPSISSNVVPVLLPKRPTHALQLYSFGMEFDVTQRYAMSTLEREERRNPCGVPQPQSLQSPQPWFSALHRSGARASGRWC